MSSQANHFGSSGLSIHLARYAPLIALVLAAGLVVAFAAALPTPSEAATAQTASGPPLGASAVDSPLARLRIALTALAAALVVLGFAAFIVTDWLIRTPLSRLAAALRNATNDTSTVQMWGRNRRDELGELARAAEHLQWERVEASAATAAATLETHMEALEDASSKAVRQYETVAKNLTDWRTDAQSVLDRLNQAADKLHQTPESREGLQPTSDTANASDDLTQATNQLNAALEQVRAIQRNLANRSTPPISIDANALATRIAPTVARHTEAALRPSIDRLDASCRQVDQAAQNAPSAERAFESACAELAQLVDEATQAHQSVSDSAASLFQDTAPIGRLAAIAAEFDEHTGQQAAAAHALEDMRREQAQTLETLRSLVERFASAPQTEADAATGPERQPAPRPSPTKPVAEPIQQPATPRESAQKIIQAIATLHGDPPAPSEPADQTHGEPVVQERVPLAGIF